VSLNVIGASEPAVQTTVSAILGDVDRAISHNAGLSDLVNVMRRVALILTDSGACRRRRPLFEATLVESRHGRPEVISGRSVEGDRTLTGDRRRSVAATHRRQGVPAMRSVPTRSAMAGRATDRPAVERMSVARDLLDLTSSSLPSRRWASR